MPYVWPYKVYICHKKTPKPHAERHKKTTEASMENYLDELILQARLDIERAQSRLTMLSALKESMSVNETNVSVSEASRLIGISEQSIRLWLKAGKIKGHLVGGSYRIDMDSIKEVLKGN